MHKKRLLRMKRDDRVEIRFLPEDTFTPQKWEAARLATIPTMKDGSAVVSVILDSGCFVANVKHKLIRIQKK